MRRILCIYLLFHGFSTGVFAWNGALTSFIGYPLWSGMPDIPLEDPQILPKGTESRQTLMSLGNIYRRDLGALTPGNIFFLDTDSLLEAFILRKGLGEGFDWKVTIVKEYFFPGKMDPFLSSFHGMFKFPNQGREGSPENQSTVYVFSPTATLLNQKGSWGGVASFTSAIRWIGIPGLLTWNGAVKIPLPNPGGFLFTDQWGASFHGVYADTFFDLGWGGLLGVIVQNPGTVSKVFASRWFLPSFGFYLSYKLNSDLIASAQVVAMLSPIDTNSPYSGPWFGQSQFGFKGNLGSGWFWEAGIIEEFPTYASLEVAFYGSLLWKP